jgi:hypothetical protein
LGLGRTYSHTSCVELPSRSFPAPATGIGSCETLDRALRSGLTPY